MYFLDTIFHFVCNIFKFDLFICIFSPIPVHQALLSSDLFCLKIGVLLPCQFTQGPFLSGMYWEVWYNNESLPENQSFIFYENLLLGVPRLRQVKVRNDSCSVHEDLRDGVPDCYNVYTPSNEDTAPFGPKNGTALV